MRRLRTPVAIAVLATALAAAPRPAAAVPYEREIQIENEEDLYELYQAGEISEDTFRTLQDLYRAGVNLDRADREELYTLPNITLEQVDGILAYRKEVGKILDPTDLVAQGVLGADDLLGIAAFLVMRPVGRPKYATDAWLRAPFVWTAEDSRFPATALQGRLATFRNLTMGGAIVLARNSLDEVVYDPGRAALTAGMPSARLELPKLYARWDEKTWGVLVGSYQVGFGQRLTFDTTDRYLPNGFYPDQVLYRQSDLVRGCIRSAGELPESPCAGDADYVYVTPDFRWREGLFGVTAGARQMPLENGWAQGYGFLSIRNRSVYQYEIYDRARCDDPTRDDDEACKAPPVYEYQDDPLAPAATFKYRTLPDMWREMVAGGNFAFFRGRRSHVGVTGYVSKPTWLTDGMDLDFQEWSRFPRGGPFGAIGADIATGWQIFDWAFEFTRSFDSMGEAGGGFGGLGRTTATWGKNEVELALRWYGVDFVNPYAGAIAAADETDGQRVRDEVGGRLRYTALLERRLKLRALADVWYTPSIDVPKVLASVRADYKLTSQMDAGLWTQYYDKDLSEGGRGACFDTGFEEDVITNEPVPCSGQQIRAAGRFGIEPIKKRLRLTAQYQHSWQDDPNHPGDLRQDLSGWLLAAYRPIDPLRLRLRLRYLSEDVVHPEYLEESAWAYVDATYRLPRQLALRLRYDTVFWLDDRASTERRQPNPEHWLMAEIEAWF